MVAVEGTDDIVDLIPAPGTIYEEGTFRNKANDLSDAVAALFNMGTNAVQNDVFAWLGKYNTHWWRVRNNASSYVEQLEPLAYQNVMEVPNTSSGAYTVYYYDSLTFDASGNYVLSGEHTVNISYDTYTNASVLRGKYFYTTRNGTSIRENLYYAPTTANVTRVTSGSGQTWYYARIEAHIVLNRYVDATSAWQYVSSSDRNAYPDSGVVNNIEYQYVGVPFENTVNLVRVATGKYTGTGTYGSSNPVKLTCGFKPKFILISKATDPSFYSSSDSASINFFYWFDGFTKMTVQFAYLNSWTFVYAYGTILPDGFSFYTNATPAYNASGTEYRFIAIG